MLTLAVNLALDSSSCVVVFSSCWLRCGSALLSLESSRAKLVSVYVLLAYCRGQWDSVRLLFHRIVTIRNVALLTLCLSLLVSSSPSLPSILCIHHHTADFE